MLTFRSYGDRDTLVRPAIRACRQGRYRDGLFARDRPFYRFRTCSARRFGSGQPRRHIRIVRFRCSWSSFARSSKTLAPAVVAAGSVGEASGRQAILEVALALGRGENKGRIHILVHNAAVSGFAPLGALTEEHIDEVIGINLRGVMLLTSLVCAHMPEHAGGRVIFVSSVGSRYTPPPGLATYSATKSAMVSLARTWATEGKEKGVNFNCVDTGNVDTALFRQAPPE